MVLPNNMTSFSTVMARFPQQKVAQTISVLLLIYIAFLAAKITWLAVPDTNATGLSANSSIDMSKQNQGRKGVNTSLLQALNLFGVYSEEEMQSAIIAQDAPETRLQLVLSGLVASDDTNTAAAIIENSGKQETYGIGDIIIGTRATLEQVLMDRVLIKQSGRMETLMLDGFDFNQPALALVKKGSPKKSIPSPSSAKIVDQRLNKKLSASAVNLRNDLNKDPGKITDYLRISPRRSNGSVVGYLLKPGKSPEFFTLAGLKSGDVAVQMNGFDLTITSEAVQALTALKQDKDVSLLVKRKEQLITILFSID